MIKLLSLKNKEIKGVIFDLGGTLVQTTDCSWEDGFKALYKKYASTVESEAVFVQKGMGYLDLFDELKASTLLEINFNNLLELLFRELEIVLPISVSTVCVEFYEASTSREIISDPHQTLGYLAGKQRRLGLASNSMMPEKVTLVELKKFKLDQFFADNVIVSSKSTIKKPHPFMFLWLANKWGVHPQNVLVVGDSEEKDRKAAEAAGMHSLILNKDIDDIKQITHLI